MGWKIVRDLNEKWCQEHGVSGRWRESKNPIRGLARKLIEEAAEYNEAYDPTELYDLQDVLEELLAIVDPHFQAYNQHCTKIDIHGRFSRHIEWNPLPPPQDSES